MAESKANMDSLTEAGEKQKRLILRNLQEALQEDKLIKHIATGKNIHIYWGTATTGRPHIGYFVPVQKIADFLHAGVKVTILFADLHAFLDNMKSSFVLLENRVLYYERIIKALLTALGVPIEELHFVKGSSHQLTEAYTQDLLKLCLHVSERDSLKAGAEVVKQVENPLLSGMLYPLLQALDEQHLKVDGQFGGVDQRKIFILAEEQLPKIKFGKRFHLMNSMVPGLTGTKMSSSEENTKIDLLDKPEVVNRKIDTAACPKKNTGQDNGILAFFKFVVLPILQNQCEVDSTSNESTIIIIDKREFRNYDEIEDAFESDKLSEQALKKALKDFLNGILSKIQEQCNNDEMQEIIKNAYPANNEITDNQLVKDSSVSTEGQNTLMNSEKETLEQITCGFQCLNLERLTQRLREKKTVKVLWRCSVKGHVNLAHMVALLQLKRLQQLGCECSVIVSDLGAFLDNSKCSWQALEARFNYYSAVLKSFMDVLGLQNVSICNSREKEFKKDYTLDMYKVVSNVTRDASALVSGHSMAGHLCPVYFALDIYYSDADLVLVGESQLKFAQFAVQTWKELGMKAPSLLIHNEILGMNGSRMSTSEIDHHLDPFDTPKQIRQKIAKSFCEPGNLNGNIALHLMRYVIFNTNLKDGEELLIERTDANGGNLTIRNYKELETLFKEEKLHPADLKATLSNKINDLFNPVRESLSASSKQLLQSAFPVNKGAKKK
ncbi:tRNA synthetases class I (W and y) domain-containing protein [Ditylenchus destructor]|nr:tRNA synthetases class I (W and y) domain-containing protein [Ditylenchus destructor]